jgi:hypothetical protein
MRRQEHRDRPGIAGVEPSQRLHERDHSVRIPPGSSQDLHADSVRLPFIVPAEAKHVPLGHQLSARLRRARPAVVAEEGPEQAEQTVRDEPLADLAGGVTACDMRDLVGEDTSQLRLVGACLDGAAVNPDGTTRQRERVDLPVVSDREAIRIRRAGRMGRKRLAESTDVSDGDRIRHLRHLRLDVPLRLTAQGDLILHGEQ